MRKILLLLSTAFILSCGNSNSKNNNGDDGDLPNGWTEEQKDEFIKDAIKQRKDAAYTSKDLKKFASCYFDELAPELKYKDWRDTKDAADSDELTSKQKKTMEEIEDLEKSCLAALKKKKKEPETEENTTNNDNGGNRNWTTAQREAGWQTVYANTIAKGWSEASAKKYCDCYVNLMEPQMTYQQFIGANPDQRLSDMVKKANDQCVPLLKENDQ